MSPGHFGSGYQSNNATPVGTKFNNGAVGEVKRYDYLKNRS
jgi:hypothetical protein